MASDICEETPVFAETLAAASDTTPEEAVGLFAEHVRDNRGQLVAFLDDFGSA